MPKNAASGDFIRNPDRRAKLLVLIQGVWVATLLVLLLWWVTLLKQQSEEIANLETQLGVSEIKVQNRLERTTRMLTSESSAFVLLILITNGILVYLFIRDHRRSKSLQAFFASLTHELRTPLTSIKLQAETLQDIEDNPKHAPFVNRLLEDVARLEGQVQQTLELARLEGGGSLALQPVSIKSFIRTKTIRMYENANNKVTFTSDLQELPEASIHADTTALTMIFRNILDNAIKYTKEHPAQMSIQGELRGNLYKVILTHENASIAADASSLGELFYRGENSQGAGVGLYLIKSLMQKMKGNANFEIKKGFTTELTFKADPGGDHGQ